MNNLSINIRKKEYKDIESYEKIITLAWQQTYKGIVSDALLEKLKVNELQRIKKKQESFDSAKETSFILSVNNKDIGVCRIGQSDFNLYPNSGQIIALYLLNGFKGLGLGKL